MAAARGVSGSVGGDKPRSRAALWVDYDGDRRLDLLVIGDAFQVPLSIGVGWTKPRLYKQLPDGAFEDVSDETGLSSMDMHSDCDCASGSRFGRHLGSVAAGDLNGDGYPELVVGLWQGAGENLPGQIGLRIFLNVPRAGGRAYEDVTIETIAPGIVNPGLDHFGSHWQIVLHDFNQDGLLDIYTAIDFDDNHMWLNQGSTPDPLVPEILRPNQMLDVAATAPATHPRPGVPKPPAETDMGVTMGDVNNDSLMDLFITKTEESSPPLSNDLYVATGGGAPAFTDPAVDAYVDRAHGAGLSRNVTDPRFFGWGWGCTFADLDRDGWVDLTMTNGQLDRQVSRLMLNDANPPLNTFSEKVDAVYNRSPGGTFGSTVIAADLDRDGDLDLIETMFDAIAAPPGHSPELRVLWNDPDCGAGPCPAWMVVRPRMDGANTHALGAVVHVAAGSGSSQLNMTRVITAGTSMAGQEPAEAFFGFGLNVAPTDPIEIEIEWPGGTTTVITGTASDLWNRVVNVGPCSVIDFAAPFGSLDFFDLLKFQDLFAIQDPRADLAAPFGTWDFADFMKALDLLSAGCP